jgi:UDP-N-acetylmuramate--alanine ligase
MPTRRAKSAKPLVLRPGAHVHLVGIGGAGLSAIAQVLIGRGHTVSGSDLQANDRTDALEKAGVSVYIGHFESNIGQADLVLASSAIPTDNVEVAAALAQGIPVLKRDEFLGLLMKDTYGIAVAGSHGKTTTTGMIAQILVEGGLDPTVIVGGVLPALGGSGRAGKGPFVVEADEYDYMFLGLRPQLAVITNIEYDHPDLFATVEAYRSAFEEFVATLPEDGRLIVCADEADVKGWLQGLDLPLGNVVTYGLDEGQWRATDLRLNQSGGTDFVVHHDGQTVGLARLRVPGIHNVRNALAAVAVCRSVGVDFGIIRTALASFGGVGRRFEIVGQVGGVTVVDDYAHHPTEIRATLAAARQRFPGRRLWAVWQPHTYSRTKRLMPEFAGCFGDADTVIVLDIYRSRESDDLGVDAAMVVQTMAHEDARYVGGTDEATEYVLQRARPGDVIMTLSAGDANVIGRALLVALDGREGNSLRTNGRDNE